MTQAKGPVKRRRASSSSDADAVQCSTHHKAGDPFRKLKKELSRTASSSSFSSFLSSFSRQNSTLDPDVRAMSTIEMIEAVRSAVLDEVSINPDLYYPEDVENIRTSTYAVKRFMVRVRAANDGHLLEKSTEDIIRNLKWRKEVKILERTEETFPAEFFHTKLIGYGQNQVNGKKMLYINTKIYRRQPELTPHFHAYGNALFDRIDKELIAADDENGRNKSMDFFLDLSDLALQNADVNFLRYYINLMVYEFPLILNNTYLYEPAWYIKPIASAVLAVLPKTFTKRVKILDRKSAIELLGEHGVPEAAGGKLNTYVPPPKGAPTVEEYAQTHNLSWNVVKKALKDYKLI